VSLDIILNYSKLPLFPAASILTGGFTFYHGVELFGLSYPIIQISNWDSQICKLLDKWNFVMDEDLLSRARHNLVLAVAYDLIFGQNVVCTTFDIDSLPPLKRLLNNPICISSWLVCSANFMVFAVWLITDLSSKSI
jgi:hypothetical protein